MIYQILKRLKHVGGSFTISITDIPIRRSSFQGGPETNVFCFCVKVAILIRSANYNDSNFLATKKKKRNSFKIKMLNTFTFFLLSELLYENALKCKY